MAISIKVTATDLDTCAQAATAFSGETSAMQSALNNFLTSVFPTAWSGDAATTFNETWTGVKEDLGDNATLFETVANEFTKAAQTYRTAEEENANKA